MRSTSVPRRLRQEQHGQTLILALTVLVVGMLVALAAVAYALNAGQNTTHDGRVRRAQQAADAGIQAQLYEQAGGSDVGYNFTGGTLGSSQLLDCALAKSGVGDSITVNSGAIGVAVSTDTACPEPTPGSTCTLTLGVLTCKGGSSPWVALDNEDWQESEFFPNGGTQGTCNTTGTALCSFVEFPEIVSIGCDEAASGSGGSASSTSGSCTGLSTDGSNSRTYARELAVLKPTAPLQALEAENDLTINPSVTLLSDLENLGSPSLATIFSDLYNNVSGLTGLLGGSTPNSTGCANLVSGAVTTLLNSLVAVPITGPILKALLNGLGVPVPITLTNFQSALCGVLDATTAGGTLAIVDGNVTAANNLLLPNTVLAIDPNTVNGTLSYLASSLPSVLSGLLGSSTTGGLLGDLGNVFEYGASRSDGDGNVCLAGGLEPSEKTTDTDCSPHTTPSYTSLPINPIGGTIKQATSTCTAGEPPASGSYCTLDRQAVNITSAATPTGGTCDAGASCNGVPSGAIATSGATVSYSNGELTVSGTGSVELTAAGSPYVFCNVSVTGSADLTNSASGAVQIYVLPPGGNSASTCGQSDGNFVACDGVSNLLAGSVNNVASILDPSGFQIYVQGAGSPGNTDPGLTNPSGSGTNPACSSTTAPALKSGDPSTEVYIGDNSADQSSIADPVEALIVYAPRSEVVVNTSLAFEGSLVGWNDEITALAILQDLDLSNHELSTAIGSYQVAQTLQCNTSVTSLTGNETSDLAGCG